MKKLIAGLAMLSLLALNPGQSRADDWEWAAVGAAAGLITGAIIADSAHHHYYGCGHYGYGHHGYHHTHYYGCGHYGHSYHHHYPGCGHYYEEYYY